MDREREPEHPGARVRLRLAGGGARARTCRSDFRDGQREVDLARVSHHGPLEVVYLRAERRTGGREEHIAAVGPSRVVAETLDYPDRVGAIGARPRAELDRVPDRDTDRIGVSLVEAHGHAPDGL